MATQALSISLFYGGNVSAPGPEGRPAWQPPAAGAADAPAPVPPSHPPHPTPTQIHSLLARCNCWYVHYAHVLQRCTALLDNIICTALLFGSQSRQELTSDSPEYALQLGGLTWKLGSQRARTCAATEREKAETIFPWMRYPPSRALTMRPSQNLFATCVYIQFCIA